LNKRKHRIRQVNERRKYVTPLEETSYQAKPQNLLMRPKYLFYTKMTNLIPVFSYFACYPIIPTTSKTNRTF